MLRIFFSLLMIVSFEMMGQSELKKDCQNICKVSRLIEEGVLLGVRIQNISLKDPYAYIVEVLPKTSAEKSGLQIGYIIQKVDDTEIKDKNHLVEVIQSYKAGDIVRLTYQAKDKIMTQKIRLGAKSTKVVDVLECCDKLEDREVALLDGLTVYPNPASREITLSTKEALEGDTHILIYTQEGKEVFYDISNKNERLKMQIDISELANGPYFVRVETNKSNYIQKFTIQK